MTTHRLYGIMTPDAQGTANFLAELLRCTFQERESDYLGIYWLARHGGSEVRVVSQPDPEGEDLEDEFSDYQTLIYVDGAPDMPDIGGTQLGLGTIETLRGDG
jgi:hypothetical protein